MVDVSIIVVNWNAKDLLAKCLRCVESTVQKVSYEVLIVDNNSSDGSQEMLRRDFPTMALIANTENFGFAKANNQAMRVAQGRYMLLLNSDAFVETDTIDHMVTFMDAHPEAGMAGCKLLYEDRSLQRSCSAFPTVMTEFYTAVGLSQMFPKSRIFGQYLMSYWNFDDTREVDSIMGAFMLVRTSALQAVGLMDESYFMYSEEVDWCYQFKRAGWKIYYHPDVQAVHLWGGSAARVKTKMHIQLYRSRAAFFRKNYGAISALLYKAVIGLSCLIRLGPGAVYFLLKPQNRYKQEATWQLLRALPSF